MPVSTKNATSGESGLATLRNTHEQLQAESRLELRDTVTAPLLAAHERAVPEQRKRAEPTTLQPARRRRMELAQTCYTHDPTPSRAQGAKSISSRLPLQTRLSGSSCALSPVPLNKAWHGLTILHKENSVIRVCAPSQPSWKALLTNFHFHMLAPVRTVLGGGFLSPPSVPFLLPKVGGANMGAVRRRASAE